MSFPFYGHAQPPTPHDSFAEDPSTYRPPPGTSMDTTSSSSTPAPSPLPYGNQVHPSLYAVPPSMWTSHHPLQTQQAMAADSMARHGGHYPHESYPSSRSFFSMFPPQQEQQHDHHRHPQQWPTAPPTTIEESIVSPDSSVDSPRPEHLPPGQTNWNPDSSNSTTNSAVDPHHAGPFAAPRNGVIHPPGPKPKVQAAPRSRRAAASKARSNITKYASTTRSESAAPSSAVSSASSHSRPPSRASTTSGPPQTFTRPMHHAHAPPPIVANGSIRITLPNPAPTRGRGRNATGGTTIVLKGVRPDGQLLPAPPGSHLEVNDLLILHPPAKTPSSTDEPIQPMNQYSCAPCPEGYQSAFEMYTCRVCAKTYDGKNARSVARRHLQDKHNVPLALQERRTRWDAEADRPKDEVESRARNLRSKRDWAARMRQLHKLEKAHASFLESFGPKGISTPCDTHLVAPTFRNGNLARPIKDENDESETRLQWEQIPRSLREALANANNPAPTTASADNAWTGSSQFDTQYASSSLLMIPVPPIMARRPVALQRGKSGSFSTIASATSASGATSTSSDFPPARPYSAYGNQSPSSHARSVSAGQMDDANFGLAQDWEYTWGAAVHVDDETLRIALEQHSRAVATPTTAHSLEYAMQQTSVNAIEEESEDSAGSPPPVVEHPQPVQAWFPAQTYAFSTMTPSGSWNDLEVDQVNRTPQVGGSEDAEGDSDPEDNAVAESLLNLHSTPARPDESPAYATSQSAVPTSDAPAQSASSVIRGLLDAPEITPRSRPRPSRAKSMVQPFLKGRPESMTRSLSFTENHLDDPFLIYSPSVHDNDGTGPSEDDDAASKANPGAKKRRNTIASPSPLTHKRKKAQDVGSPARKPMSPLSSNASINSLSNGQQIANSWHDARKGGMTGMNGTAMNHSAMLGGGFSTPIRPQRIGAPGTLGPSTLSRVAYQFSSPGDPGAAASLGLVPEWEGGTPGLSGIVGNDTPYFRR